MYSSDNTTRPRHLSISTLSPRVAIEGRSTNLGVFRCTNNDFHSLLRCHVFALGPLEVLVRQLAVWRF